MKTGLVMMMALVCCALRTSGTLHARPDRFPAVKKGVADLRGMGADTAGTPVRLAGEWEFYYGRFIPPEVFSRPTDRPAPEFIHVPSIWNTSVSGGAEPNGQGHATYRAVILTAEPSERSTSRPFALMMPAVESAYTLFVNGIPSAANGVPGTDRQGTLPEWRPLIIDLPVGADKIELVVQISNFHHARGGFSQAPCFGSAEAVRKTRERGVALKLFTFGCLFMIAFYHVMIFCLRPREKTALYFGLFCLCMAVRSLVIEEFFLVSLFPALPWDTVVRITYLSFSLGIAAFSPFLHSLYVQDALPWGNRIFTGIGLVYSAVILVTPPMVFTGWVAGFQAVILAGGVYALGILIRAVRNGREGALLFLGAFAVYFVCILSDTFHHYLGIHTDYVAPMGFIVFISMQAVVLARRYAGAFVRIEELFQEKTKLEGAAFTLQSLSYIDPLTGVANRRRLDDYMHGAWRRSEDSGEPVSLIMIDIDFFKAYNDRFGHPAADGVLKKIAHALEACVSRPTDLVARYGGEEFAAVLPGTDLKGAFALSEIIRGKIQGLKVLAADTSASDYVSVSLGCAVAFPGAGKKPDDLIRSADSALYRAKTRGRNRTEMNGPRPSSSNSIRSGDLPNGPSS